MVFVSRLQDLQVFSSQVCFSFLSKNCLHKKNMLKTNEISNQSPKLIAIIKFLLFDYSMLTIWIVEYYSEVENQRTRIPNTTLRSQLFEYSNSSNNSWEHWSLMDFLFRFSLWPLTMTSSCAGFWTASLTCTVSPPNAWSLSSTARAPEWWCASL